MNRDKMNSMENFLRKENLKLMIENISLREQLGCKDIVDCDEIENGYREYYSKDNEVMMGEKGIFR